MFQANFMISEWIQDSHQGKQSELLFYLYFDLYKFFFPKNIANDNIKKLQLMTFLIKL